MYNIICLHKVAIFINIYEFFCMYNLLQYNLLEFWRWVHLFTPVMLKMHLRSYV